MTNDGVYTYDYGPENRLVAVNAGGAVATYAYDYQGRRISKTVGSITCEYVYDGPQVIAEYDDSGGSMQLVRKFIYGPGIDEPIIMIDVASDDYYFYHFDGLGSVVTLSDENGDIVERYEYAPFGAVSIMSANYEPRTTSSYDNPYMFTGRRFDDETQLYYYRARMYHPELGRFMQPDPIGYFDSMNLYKYCWNNPLNWIDPLGLGGKRPLWKEFTDIFEGSIGIKFGLEFKAKLLALKLKIGGGIGTSLWKLENSEFTSVLERDIEATIGFGKHTIGLGYSKEIPVELGKPMYDQATVCSTLGYSRGIAGASPWKISIGGTFIIVKGSIGLNFEEAYWFIKELGRRARE